ncbi:MAG TPA: hypothetical protein VEH30_03105 [Terriglobales bacterium]|nr:hypothetical protein [Terriglobales bacterium]
MRKPIVCQERVITSRKSLTKARGDVLRLSLATIDAIFSSLRDPSEAAPRQRPG